MRTRLFVGVAEGGVREVFRFAGTPTEKTHGRKYAAAIGPFVTRAGANYMRDYGVWNPHCQTVAEAERLAKKMQRAIAENGKKVRACELLYSTTSEGFLCISAMVDGYLEHRRYGGYSKRKAAQMFLAEMNDLKREAT